MNRKICWLVNFSSLCMMLSCSRRMENSVQGKIERETISFASKVTGRILKIYIEEGQSVRPGDTLAMLDVPEVTARITQSRGGLKASAAQHLLADNGPTRFQLKQLKAKYAAAKDHYEFAVKSFERANAMFTDSLMSPQAHDQVYAQYQGAKAQMEAAAAELNDAETGTRFETKIATAGQQEQAGGVLQEVEVAYSERYIMATNYATVETISIREGALAMAGYPVFNGYINNSTWFRFTVPESKIIAYNKGDRVTVTVPYFKKDFAGKILTIKQMPRYADITTAYPDYDIDDAIYQIKIAPDSIQAAEVLLYNATILLNGSKNH